MASFAQTELFPFQSEFGNRYTRSVTAVERIGERQSGEATYQELQHILENTIGPSTVFQRIAALLRKPYATEATPATGPFGVLAGARNYSA